MSAAKSKVGRSEYSIPKHLKMSPCGECHTGELPIVHVITEFGKEPKAEATCRKCGQCYEARNCYSALHKWNTAADPKIIAFPINPPAGEEGR